MPNSASLAYIKGMSYEITYEGTPNPHSLKFTVNAKISSKNLEIKDRNQAKQSPLAEKILGFPWAKSVFLGENFITVTKEDWLEWDMIQDPLAEIIKEHLNEGGKVLIPAPPELKNTKTERTETDETAKKIIEILEKDIQPAVAMDGGYIEFVSYEDGLVYLRMKGACSGCPSSAFTLKQGIEARLKQSLPEVKELIAI